MTDRRAVRARGFRHQKMTDEHAPYRNGGALSAEKQTECVACDLDSAVTAPPPMAALMFLMWAIKIPFAAID